MSTLTEMVKDGKKARFAFYRDGALHYETECGFLIAIPTEDAGSATFNAEEKAVHLMRWIRKQLASNEEARAKQAFEQVRQQHAGAFRELAKE